MMSSGVNQCLRSPTLPGRQTSAVAVPLQRSQQLAGRRGGAVKTEALSLATQLATTALIAGAWYLSQQQEAVEQERLEGSDRRPCPSCGGSGVQPCLCTKWSDGDVGCSSCSSSGWTKCNSCGGGGLAVPIKVSIRKN